MSHGMMIVVGFALVLGLCFDGSAEGLPEAAGEVQLLAQTRSQSPGPSGSQGIAPRTPGSGPPKPLAGPMAVEPGALPKVHVTPPTTAEMMELTKAIHDVQISGTQVGATSGSFLKYQQTCKTTNYSVEDQKAAGCQPMENLAQCGIKLYKHCMAAHSGDLSLLHKTGKTELEKVDKLEGLLKKYWARVQDALNAFPQ